jgi:hypothetical protein
MPAQNIPEFRSEEFQEVIGKPPSFLLRAGIMIVFCFLVLLLLISFLIKYPDTITSRTIITTERQPVRQKARAEGTLRLMVKNNAPVATGQIVAYIDNGANIDDFKSLTELLPSLQSAAAGTQAEIAAISLRTGLNLGPLQSGYLSVMRDLDDIKTFWTTKKYGLELGNLRQRFSVYENLGQQLGQQKRQHEQIKSLVYKEFRADSILEKQKVIAPLQLNESLVKLNQATLAIQNIDISASNNAIQISLLQEQITRLEQQMQAELNALKTKLLADIEQLSSDMETWKRQYLFTAPFEGVVSFSSFWQDNYFIKNEDEFATFIPKDDSLTCLAYVPVARSGKIAIGNKVLIQLDNYPNTEYGRLTGQISKIALVPNNGNYMLTIHLPQKLRTTYKKEIPFKQEMEGTADIITKDLRLIERVFNQFKSIFDKN